jgi:hypothetical protein
LNYLTSISEISCFIDLYKRAFFDGVLQ